MTKTALLIDMIDRLRNRPGITIGELALSLGRSERTIYRWLSELTSDVGARVHCRDGGYYLATSSESQPAFTPEELVALRTSLKSAPFAKGSRMSESAHSAWLKIRGASAADKIEEAVEASKRYSVKVTAPEGPADDATISARLEDAIAKRRGLRVVYRSQKSNEVKNYVIDPYALAFRRHSWYLLAFCREHEKVVQFKLVRFREIEETGESFQPPRGFSVEDFFKSSWEAWGGGEPVTVRVRFSPLVSVMVAENQRHPSQRIYTQPDGGVLFEATVSGIEEIAIWILGFGKEAEVLTPPELRALMTKHASALAEIYAPDEEDVESGEITRIP